MAKSFKYERIVFLFNENDGQIKIAIDFDSKKQIYVSEFGLSNITFESKSCFICLALSTKTQE